MSCVPASGEGVCGATGVVGFALILYACRLGTLNFSQGAVGERTAASTPAPRSGKAAIPWDVVAVDYTTLVLFFSIGGFRNSMVPVYGGTELGLTAGALGLILGVGGLVRLAVTLSSGFAADRYGRKITLIPGALILGTMTLAFPPARDQAGFAIALVALSLGGFGNSLPTTMLIDVVPAGNMGMAIGVNRFVGDLGALVAPALLGWLLDVYGFPTVAATTAVLVFSILPVIVFCWHEKPLSLDGGPT